MPALPPECKTYFSLDQVRSALKKPETERTEAEAAVLLLHRETVEELCKRQIRTNVLKRKQEEVRPSAVLLGWLNFSCNERREGEVSVQFL